MGLHRYRITTSVAAIQVHHVWDAISDERCESPLFLDVGVLEHLLENETWKSAH